MNLRQRLNSGTPILLDGAMGTELEQRTVDVSLPLWSAAVVEHHPEIVEEVHSDYLAVGAEVLTTATFRTTPRTFMKITSNCREAVSRAKEATLVAVSLAMKAAQGQAWVAGSMAPLEDCYRPELFPGVAEASFEFRELAEWLMEGGVDFFLIEAMTRIDETITALQSTGDLGLPRWVSFILADAEHLLSGDKLARAVISVSEHGADAVLVNCTDPLVSIEALEIIQRFTSLPLGLYPNLVISDTKSTYYSLKDFEQIMRNAVRKGARIIGSCCGSSPAHIATLARIISNLQLLLLMFIIFASYNYGSRGIT
ncbi:MAG: homocysteine S-methyltransferase family protein [Fidelibacterota bacterium]